MPFACPAWKARFESVTGRREDTMIEWESTWEGKCRKRLRVAVEYLSPEGNVTGSELFDATEADLHVLGWVNDDDLRAAGWAPALDLSEARAELEATRSLRVKDVQALTAVSEALMSGDVPIAPDGQVATAVASAILERDKARAEVERLTKALKSDVDWKLRDWKVRCAEAEQRALDAELQRDASRGMEQAAERRAERLYLDRNSVDQKLKDEVKAREAADRNASLRSAQLLHVESAIEGHATVDPCDTNHPAWTHTLVSAANLRRERDEARAFVERLRAELREREEAHEEDLSEARAGRCTADEEVERLRGLLKTRIDLWQKRCEMVETQTRAEIARLTHELASQRAERAEAEEEAQRITDKLKAERLAANDLRAELRERAEAHEEDMRKLLGDAEDLTIWLDECERHRDKLVKERDEARAECKRLEVILASKARDELRLKTERNELTRERDEARAEVARLKAEAARVAENPTEQQAHAWRSVWGVCSEACGGKPGSGEHLAVEYIKELQSEVERLKAEHEPKPMGVNSIGTCAICGYTGPGPKHDCKPKPRIPPSDQMYTLAMARSERIKAGARNNDVDCDVAEGPCACGAWHKQDLPERTWCHSDNRWFGEAMPASEGGNRAEFIRLDIHEREVRQAREQAADRAESWYRRAGGDAHTLLRLDKGICELSAAILGEGKE